MKPPNPYDTTLKAADSAQRTKPTANHATAPQSAAPTYAAYMADRHHKSKKLHDYG